MRYLLILICCLIPIALCAATITEWYCPKCGSTDVVQSVERPKPTFQKKSMDEYKGPFGDKHLTQIAVHEYITYRMICMKCGYKVEVTQ